MCYRVERFILSTHLFSGRALELKFSQITESQFHHQPATLKSTVVGKLDPVYKIPKTVVVDYEDDNGEKFTRTLVLDREDGELLSFIDVPINHYPGLIKKYFKIKIPKTAKFDYEIIGTQNVLRFAITNLIGGERDISGSVPFIVYYLYDNELKIEDNCSYEFEGYSTIDPKNGKATCVFNKATKLQSELDNFNIKKCKDELMIFRPRQNTVDGIFDWLTELYTYYSTNITGIRGPHRFDTHLAVDLTFHSPCRFFFPTVKDDLQRGWMDIMLLGDEGTGKTTIPRKFLEYYDMGERTTGQNTSFAGLVAGADDIGGYWVPRWGKLPMCDRRLLFVDESGDLDPKIWDNMSGIRDDGIAELAKIIKGKVNSRTRVIWNSNPKGLGRVSNKHFGITCLPELITKPADIRRFDLVVIMAKQACDNVIPNDEYNKQSELVPIEADRNLVRWAWSRKDEDILFTPSAVQTARALAKKLGTEYIDKIPLIQGQNVRIKLARMAAAFAIRLYSCVDADPRKVKVMSVHMQCVERLFDLVYGKEESGYKTYSKIELDRVKTIESADFSAVKNLFKAYGQQERERMINYFIQANRITIEDFGIWMGYPRDAATSRLSEFVRMRCLQSASPSGYYRTPPFTTFLKRELLSKEEK